MGGVEKDERVVVGGRVVGRVEGRHLNRKGDSAHGDRFKSCELHRAEGRLTGRSESVHDRLRSRSEIGCRQCEALAADAAEFTERDCEVHGALAMRLNDRAGVKAGDEHVHAIAAGPSGGHDRLAGIAKGDPERLGSRIQALRRTNEGIAADGRSKAADVICKRAGYQVKGVGWNVIVSSRRTRCQRDVVGSSQGRRHRLTSVRVGAAGE